MPTSTDLTKLDILIGTQAQLDGEGDENSFKLVTDVKIPLSDLDIRIGTHDELDGQGDENTIKFITNEKIPVEDVEGLSAVATSGAYDDLSDKPDLSVKQDTISDLETIRSNAQTGAGLAPQVEVNTQRIEDLTVAKFPNVVIIGTPHIEGGQVSNYSDTSYLQFPFVDISRGQPFDIYFSFTTAQDVTTQQNILDAYFGIALAIQNGKGIMALSSNGTSWDIGTSVGTNTLLPNTTYYVKYSWTGTEYSAALSTDDQTYVPDMNLSSTLSPHKTTIFIGGSPNVFGAGSAHPFKGTINFNKSKVVVNGITVWEGMADVGLASRANVSLNNLDEVGEGRFNAKQDALVSGTNIKTINNQSLLGSGNIDITSAQWGNISGDISNQSDLQSALNTKANDSDAVHKTGNENINGVKTFIGGTGGNNVAIKAPNGIAIGGLTQTAYSQYATIRLVNDKVNTGSYYIDGNGSVLFRHKTGTKTAEGSANDVMFTMNPETGIKAGWSGTAGKGITDADLHNVLIDTVEYGTLQTTNKDVLGAINELNSGKQENLNIILLEGATIND